MVCFGSLGVVGVTPRNFIIYLAFWCNLLVIRHHFGKRSGVSLVEIIENPLCILLYFIDSLSTFIVFGLRVEHLLEFFLYFIGCHYLLEMGVWKWGVEMGCGNVVWKWGVEMACQS